MINQGLLRHLDVDLVTIMIAYLMISYGKTWAGIFATCQGFFIDIISAGILGLFTLLYLITFLSVNIGSYFFDLNSARGQIILVSMAVLLKEILLVALLKSFSLEINVSPSTMVSFGVSALVTGLIGPFLFYFLNHANFLFTGDKQED